MAEDDKKNVQIMEFPVDAEDNPNGTSGVGDITSENFFRKFSGNKLYLAVAALGIVFVLGVLYASGAFTGMAVVGQMTPEDVGEQTVKFVNSYLLQDGKATLGSVEEESGIYAVNITINGREVPIYATMDGKYIILPQGMIDVAMYEEQVAAAENQPPATTGDVPKTERPVANVFVMSYCPYGLQMEKAVIPVMELLGDKADININFVHYIMHGRKEMEENNRQYCIQKEQPEIYVDYLRCFVQSGDTAKCQEEAGVDSAQLETCLQELEDTYAPTKTFESSNERFPPYPVDAALAQKYGVGGSPTFVLNGKTLQVSRSPEAVKQAICDAFAEPPEECDTELNSETTSPGIGPMSGGTASASGATCG